MTVELYYFQPLGTNSGRVFLALLEKGVPFVERELKGPLFEHHQPAYLAINPRGQVPSLVHDGRVYTEGTTINEYIDEAFDGPPLKPVDLYERWSMRRWCRFIDNELGRCLMMIHWNRIVPVFVGVRDEADLERILARVPDPDRRAAWRKAYKQETPADQIAESRRRLHIAAQDIERALSQGPWLAGSEYSLADIDLINFYGMFPGWFPELVNETATPHTLDWIRRMEERPAVEEMRSRTSGRRTQAPEERASA